ncbi:MAG TPA: cupin [Desulfovibrio sp.]|nr:cupin [Desulfovibrio sp.]
MKKIEVFAKNGFKDTGFSPLLVHESPYMKVLNFNFKPGQELPVHSHAIDGELTIAVLEGTGAFLSQDGSIPAGPGDVLVSEIAVPHGLRAETAMRVLVTIAPPI